MTAQPATHTHRTRIRVRTFIRMQAPQPLTLRVPGGHPAVHPGGPPMRFHTTCSSCGAELVVADHRMRTCVDCPPSPDPGDVLERNFLAAALRDDPQSRFDAACLADELDAYQNRPPDMVGAALAYAAWGWPVFALRAGHKTPIPGSHGLKDATTDPVQIRQWWELWPAMNVGLATGHAFDVVDVDPKGLQWWVWVREGDQLTDIHGQVSTPRGGYHLYVPATGGRNLAGLAPGVDYRGLGGYVVAPPSVLVADAISGRPAGPVPNWPLRYTWLVRPSPALTGFTGSNT